MTSLEGKRVSVHSPAGAAGIVESDVPGRRNAAGERCKPLIVRLEAGHRFNRGHYHYDQVEVIR
jgi:hypothetical protein